MIPEVYTSLRLSLDDDNLTLSSYNVTGYDMAVMDAVCTMYEHGCTIFHSCNAATNDDRERQLTKNLLRIFQTV